MPGRAKKTMKFERCQWYVIDFIMIRCMMFISSQLLEIKYVLPFTKGRIVFHASTHTRTHACTHTNGRTDGRTDGRREGGMEGGSGGGRVGGKEATAHNVHHSTCRYMYLECPRQFFGTTCRSHGCTNSWLVRSMTNLNYVRLPVTIHSTPPENIEK